MQTSFGAEQFPDVETPRNPSHPSNMQLMAFFAMVSTVDGFMGISMGALPKSKPCRAPSAILSMAAHDQDQQHCLSTMNSLMCALEALHDAEKLSVSQKRKAVYTTNRARKALKITRTSSLIIRQQLEHAILRAEDKPSSAVKWPSALLAAPLSELQGYATNNVLSLPHWMLASGSTHSAHRRATPAVSKTYLEPTHANDAWMLSSLIWNWRNGRQFKRLRTQRSVPEYAVTEAACMLHSLVGEYRGGRRPSESHGPSPTPPIRTVRQLIHHRGGRLSELLEEFDESIEEFAA